jgi:hypothetical protein
MRGHGYSTNPEKKFTHQDSASVIDPPQNDRSIRLKMTAESGSK